MSCRTFCLLFSGEINRKSRASDEGYINPERLDVQGRRQEGEGGRAAMTGTPVLYGGEYAAQSGATERVRDERIVDRSAPRGQGAPGATPPALAESQREFASLLNVLSGTFYRCELTPPWRMTFVSEGVQNVTGYSVRAFEEMAWEHLMHPGDAGRVQRNVAKAIAAETPFSADYRIFDSSGQIKWVREKGHAVYGQNGEALFLEGMIADISEEQRLRQAGVEAERTAEGYARQLTQVLESTSDCVFSLDGDWRFTYLNGRAGAEIFPSGDISGRHILEVFPQLEETIFWPVYQEVMRERKPRQVEAFLPGLEHWYEAHAAPIDDGITVFFRNIDDRKRAEEAARERECQLRRTLDHIPQMVWCTRPDGYHDYYSRVWYEFTGAPIGSTNGPGWNGMFHPDDQERAWELWRQSLSTGEPYEIEYRLRHHTGEYRWVLGRAWSEKNEMGEILRWYGTCTDIHDRVQAQEALHESRSVQQGVLEASADCIKIILPDGTLDYMNARGLYAMEIESLSTIRGRSWASLWPPEGREGAEQALDRALSNRSARFTGFCPTVTGKSKWWDVVVTPIKDEHGAITRLLSISRDITNERETSQQLKWASEHDALTNLPNRRALAAHLHGATIRAMRSGGEVALLLVGLDHFKHVNDTLGHPAGDHLLTVFARRLQGSVRPTDFVARLGGDEFAIIMEEEDGKIDPAAIGEAVVAQLRQPVRFESRYISSGASIGGAVFPRDAGSANELLKHADIALYALKGGGRGGIRMFQNQMREHAQVASAQLTVARVAISEKSVEPHYQQKIDLKTGRIAGVEALLRWRHGMRGLQLPDTVCEAFKDYELAAKIGDLMQRAVFRDLRSWLDRGLDVGFVAVNAAPAEFLRDDFAERLLQRLAEQNISPSLIEIEVTEHVFLERGSDYVARALQALHAAGVRIALDDFGTGHSSLSHLRDFPVDVVKIDRSFVETMASDTEVRAIVSAVISLSRSIGIEVVAEGVESELQRNILLEEGCQLGQGYHFGKPVEAGEVQKLFRSVLT